MKALAIIFLLVAISLPTETLPAAFQKPNPTTGIPINIKRFSGQFNYQNWFLNDLGVDPKIKKVDKFSNSFPFGYVQFQVAADVKMCLQIAPSGFLALKNCKQDYDSGEFETIFQIIPTSSGAMQLRSLVLKTNECLGTFENPNVPIEDRVGLVRCVLEFFVDIEPKQLFVFSPPLSEAKVIR